MTDFSKLWSKSIQCRKVADQKNKENYKVISKGVLTKNITTKMRTAMIGNIDSVERTFGHLWGHGKDYNSLSDHEKKWRKVWEVCRKEILDKGNGELRAAQNEIQEYTVERNVYNKVFSVIGGRSARD